MNYWKCVRVPGICKLHLENYHSKLSFLYWIMSFVSKHCIKCLCFHSLDLFMSSNLIFTLVSHIRVIYFVSLQKHTLFFLSWLYHYIIYIIYITILYTVSLYICMLRILGIMLHNDHLVNFYLKKFIGKKRGFGHEKEN